MAGIAQESISAGSAQCAICLEREAHVVAIPCGHLVCCVACRRRLVHEARVNAGESHDTNVARRNLSTKQLERTRVVCPICRTEGSLRLVDRFDGLVFIPAEHQDEGEELQSSEDLEACGAGSDQAQAKGPSSSTKEPELVPGDDSALETASTTASTVSENTERMAPSREEKQEAQIKAQLQKLWRASTTSLMNDQGMDSFLGAAIYRFMQNPDFRRDLHFGGKAGKYANKRRKAKFRMSAGVRLDGQTCNGGSLTITVAQVEDMEKAIGKLIVDMQKELDAIRPQVLKFQKQRGGYTKLADSVEEYLNTYSSRHEQRTADLAHMIDYGVIQDGQDEIKNQLQLQLPQQRGLTTFLIDGTQLYKPSDLLRTHEKEILVCFGDKDKPGAGNPPWKEGELDADYIKLANAVSALSNHR